MVEQAARVQARAGPMFNVWGVGCTTACVRPPRVIDGKVAAGTAAIRADSPIADAAIGAECDRPQRGVNIVGRAQAVLHEVIDSLRRDWFQGRIVAGSFASGRR